MTAEEKQEILKKSIRIELGNEAFKHNSDGALIGMNIALRETFDRLCPIRDSPATREEGGNNDHNKD